MLISSQIGRPMFRAKTLAILSIVFLIISILQQGWIRVSMISALLVVAIYLALAIEKEIIKSPSPLSQLSLFTIGALLILSSYMGIGHVLDETAVDNPDLIIVIGGFMLFPLLSLMGIAMAGCSIASKNASHDWLKYLAKKPKWIKDDFA